MFSSQADKIVRANNFQNADRTSQQTRWIVMHTTEGTDIERPSAAEDIAAFFARSTTEVSAHYVVDNNSTVGCVAEEDIAFHALGANSVSLGIEQAGKAGQSAAQWDDEYSQAMLTRSARLAGDIAKRRGIPARFLSDRQLRDGDRGFASHDAISRVFGDNIRDDPGPHFPWDDFLADVKRNMGSDRVEFVLASGEGDLIAVSATVRDEKAVRVERLREFTDNRAAAIDAELQDDRDVILRVRRAG